MIAPRGLCQRIAHFVVEEDAVEIEPPHARAFACKMDGLLLHLARRAVLFQQLIAAFTMLNVRVVELVDLAQRRRTLLYSIGDWDSVPTLIAATPQYHGLALVVSVSQPTQDRVVGKPRPVRTSSRLAPLASAKRSTMLLCGRSGSFSSRKFSSSDAIASSGAFEQIVKLVAFILVTQCLCSTPQPIMASRPNSPLAHFSVIGWLAQCRSRTASSSSL